MPFSPSSRHWLVALLTVLCVVDALAAAVQGPLGTARAHAHEKSRHLWLEEHQTPISILAPLDRSLDGSRTSKVLQPSALPHNVLSDSIQGALAFGSDEGGSQFLTNSDDFGALAPDVYGETHVSLHALEVPNQRVTTKNQTSTWAPELNPRGLQILLRLAGSNSKTRANKQDHVAEVPNAVPKDDIDWSSSTMTPHLDATSTMAGSTETHLPSITTALTETTPLSSTKRPARTTRFPMTVFTFPSTRPSVGMTTTPQPSATSFTSPSTDPGFMASTSRSETDTTLEITDPPTRTTDTPSTIFTLPPTKAVTSTAMPPLPSTTAGLTNFPTRTTRTPSTMFTLPPTEDMTNTEMPTLPSTTEGYTDPMSSTTEGYTDPTISENHTWRTTFTLPPISADMHTTTDVNTSGQDSTTNSTASPTNITNLPTVAPSSTTDLIRDAAMWLLCVLVLCALVFFGVRWSALRSRIIRFERMADESKGDNTLHV